MIHMPTIKKTWLHRLWRDRRASYSVISALMLPVLTGFAALGTETGLWFYTHQNMQSAADGAAFSAAVARVHGNDATFQNEATAVAARYGFVNGNGGTLVNVNRPPASGPNVGNANAVEVVIQQPQQLLLASVFLSAPIMIAARAVANATGAAVACIIGLDPTAANTVLINNNATLPDPDCGVASNSSAANGMTVTNNARVYGPTISHGGTSVQVNSMLLGGPNLTNAAPVLDPYADNNPPAPPPCTAQNGIGTNNGTRTLVPDVTVGGVGMTRFCGGLDFSNNFQATFAPGIYYVDSQLVFGNNAIIRGTNVTFVVNGNYAISLGNNANIDITAPIEGPTSGILFFGSRTGTPTVQQTFANNTVLNLTGAVYFPNQIVNFNNNGTTAPTGGCTQVIGRMVRLANNVNIRANCNGTGTTAVNFAGAANLIE
jgi:hypothetical protein